MRSIQVFFLAAILATTFSCGSKVDQGIAEDQAEVSTEKTALLPEQPAVCIWKEVGVRETPAEKGKYLTTVYLGEKALALGDTASEVVGNRRYQYRKLRLADGTEGWIRSDFVATGATPAAFLKEAPIYRRPDIMTSTGKNFNQMDFVAIRETGDGGWVEVIGKRMGDTWFSSGWVKVENLTTQPNDVAFSVFYSKAMDLEDESARYEEIQALLKNSDLSSSVFYSVVANMYGEPGEDEYVEE